MLNVNLKILPLKDVEFFVHQKCLLPTTAVEFLRPSAWINCVSDNGSGFLCQAYLREMPPKTCQLDDSVVTFNAGNMKQENVPMHIVQRIELMEYQESPIEEVQLIFVLNAKFFCNKMSKHKLERKLLEQKSLTTLLTHTLCNNCIVSNSQLRSFGIAKIKINAATAENVAFNISEGTKLQIEDVQMQEATPSRPLNTNILTVYQEAHEELQKLLALSKTPTELKRGFYSGLNAIITGVSGVGKSTLLNTFLQQKAKFCNSFPITVSAVMGQYPGEIQMKLRHIFQAAKQFVRKFKPKRE